MKVKNKLVSAGVIASLLALAACGGGKGTANTSDSLKGQQLVFVNYGGDSLDAAKKGWLEPFSKETGVEVATDSPTDTAKIKTMVEGGRTTWDVVDSDVAVGGSQCGTLFDKRPAGFDMSQIDPKYVTDDCMVPIMVQAVAVVYNKKLYGNNPPTKAEDFLNTTKFPGKRIFFSYPTGTVEPLLMTDGVAPDKLFPIDWTKVQDVFNKLGKNAVPQATLAAQSASLESGDFGMCVCYLGRAAVAAQNGADIGVLWDKTYLAWDGAYAIKGSKYPKAQWALMQYLATTKGQNPFYEYLPYGPTTTGEQPAVNAEFRGFLPGYNGDKIKETYSYDVKYWTDNINDAVDRWTKLTTG